MMCGHERISQKPPIPVVFAFQKGARNVNSSKSLQVSRPPSSPRPGDPTGTEGSAQKQRRGKERSAYPQETY